MKTNGAVRRRKNGARKKQTDTNESSYRKLEGCRPLLREREAADFLNVSTAYLRISRHRGDPEAPPWIIIGQRSIRYEMRSLEKYIDERRQGV